MSDRTPYALVSVSDKTGIAEFAEGLVERGFAILSTGGTADHLASKGIEVRRVSDVTEFPEILDGRVKTLHPKIHGSVLARDGVEQDRQTLADHGIPDISVVAVNLYPFERTLQQEERELASLVEMIDIGGPTLLRAAAKNFPSKTVVVDRDDYSTVLEAIDDGGADESLRRRLALKAFRHTARYDAVIAEHFEGEVEEEGHDQLPETLSLGLARTDELRYGENPHQKGALYRKGADPDWGGFEKLNGKALSYNNLVDLDAAVQLTLEFARPAVSIIKHTNPAGCAVGSDLDTAYERALDCDPMSAFGGIVVANGTVEAELGERLADRFFEVIAAPDYSDEALEALTQKKNVRVLRMPEEVLEVPRVYRATVLGVVSQTADPAVAWDVNDLEIPTDRQPTEEELRGLAFNWRVCKHVKSNAIVLGGADRTLGIGAGQMSRVDAVEFAVQKSRHELDGAMLASDAFFPFRDGIDAANDAGVRAVVQPGGSKRDGEVIQACNEHGIAMVMTGERHFRH